MVGGDPQSDSWISSLTSWLMRSGADDDDAGLEQILLSDHPIFGTLPEMQRFLYVNSIFANVQTTLDEWTNPLSASLGEWVNTTVRHVLENKYESTDGLKNSPRGSTPRDGDLSADVRKIVGPDAV